MPECYCTVEYASGINANVTTFGWRHLKYYTVLPLSGSDVETGFQHPFSSMLVSYQIYQSAETAWQLVVKIFLLLCKTIGSLSHPIGVESKPEVKFPESFSGDRKGN